MSLINVGTAGELRLSWLRHLATLSIDQAFDELKSHEAGLGPEEVEESRAEWGANVVGAPDRPSVFSRLLSVFSDPFTDILVVLAIVSFVTDVAFAQPGQRDPSTTLIILVMVGISVLMREVQERRSANAAEALARSIQTTCCVERADAGRAELPLDQVVVGDVIHLRAGDIVPADVRLTHARDLFVSQASLTGESAPVERCAAALDECAAASREVTDLPNVALMGSTVISGGASCVVVAVGEGTAFGRVASSLGEVRPKGAYQRSLDEVGALFMRMTLVIAPLVLLANGLTKGDWLAALLFASSVAVGLTPEMLPMIVTACLAKGAQDLSRGKAIVKRLDAVQNLGSIDVLCTDKTGTLTENRVVLERHLDALGREDDRVLFEAFLNSFFETGLRNLVDSAIIRRTQELSAAARDAGESDEAGVVATGVAMTSGARDLPSADELAERYTLVDELPFDFERRLVSVVVGDERGRTHMITKGAVEEVLAACSEVDLGGEACALGDDLRTQVMERAAAMASEGMRVLGVARKAEPAGVRVLSTKDERDMRFIGFLAFLDPPKESSKTAIAALASHGVGTKVLTGDSARVAVHVCRAIGLDVGGVLEGSDVEAMDDVRLAQAAEDVTVFAKLAPDQKARVVAALRANGHVVGYMGDGVNDAPAMRQSDCGISVEGATDVARETADIILLEKDLMVLERGIMAGRHTFANMEKYVRIAASSNFGNVFSVLAASLFLPFLPMRATQMLLLNLLSDIACTAIPWDNVDEESVAAPNGWDVGSLGGYMRRIGPVSSAFDLLTFGLLFFWVCPAVAGGSWAELAAAGAGMAARRALFVAVFQGAWFTESLVTQLLAVQVMRTRKLPFVQSRASWRVTLVAVAVGLLGAWLPLSPLAEPLDFAALPAWGLGVVAVVCVAYVLAAMVANRLVLVRGVRGRARG